MCAGTREDGTQIEANDPLWDELTAAAKSAQHQPDAWLKQTRIYGGLSEQKRFTNAFSHWLNLIWSEGAEAALAAYVAQERQQISG